MKITLLALILLMPFLLIAQNEKPENFSGVITYDNGEFIRFNWIGRPVPYSPSGATRTTIEFSRNLHDFDKHLDRQTLILKNVEEIDFIPFSIEEKNAIKSFKYSHSRNLRKANVIFHDEDTWTNVYLKLDDVRWKYIRPEDDGRATPVQGSMGYELDKLLRIVFEYNDGE